MANWLASKTMLTTKGLTMLGKVQAGIGTLTITRAEIGKTFSDVADLPNLDVIPSPALPALINSKTAAADGSNLSLVLSNSELTQGFNLCQIGIYATHPDIDSGAEVLYFISQSESPADFMPSNSDNIIQQVYNIYLRHDLVSNPNIKVVGDYPIATTSSLGVVSIGDTLNISPEGVLNTKGLGIPISVTQPTLDKGQMWFEVTT